MRLPSPLLAALFSLPPVLLLGCSVDAANPPPAAPIGQTPIDQAPVADSGAALAVAPQAPLDPDAGTAGFSTCSTSADCIAVQRVGCCNDGVLVAVARSSADAYAKSFVCSQAPVCPPAPKPDARVPRCSPSRHQCELVGRGVYVK